MDDLKNLTPTQLLKLSNDIKQKHEDVKKDIINITIKVDELEKEINDNLAQLTDLEKKYVLIVGEIDNRE